MRRRLDDRALFGLLLMACGSAAWSSVLPVELQRCREEADNARRLECFDRESARLLDRESSPPLAEQETQSPEQRFGFRGDVAREALDSERRSEAALERLQTKVMAVRLGPTGYWVVTLDNGQEWSQVPLGVRVPIKAGESVTILPLALGSFVLVPESGQSTRVRRRR